MERKAKLEALRKTIDASSARGGSHSAEEVRAAVKARLVLPALAGRPD
jgi:hypothetical protein